MRRGARCGVRVCAIEKGWQENYAGCKVQVSGFELLTERAGKVLRVQPCNLHLATRTSTGQFGNFEKIKFLCRPVQIFHNRFNIVISSF